MDPQIACMDGCKVALVAFVWLFSSVCFHVCPQTAFMIRCIVTQVAFLWLFSSVCFQMCTQIACMRTRLHLFNFSSFCVFKCVLKSFAWEDAYSQRLYLFDFSLESSCSRFCSIATRKSLSPVAVSFKLRKFKCKIEKENESEINWWKYKIQ